MSYFTCVREFLARSGAPLRLPRAHCEAPAVEAPPAAAAAPSGAADFTLYQVLGYRECPWFSRAVCISSDLAVQPQWVKRVEVNILPFAREDFGTQLEALAEILPASAGHNSCPAIVQTRCRKHPHPKADIDGDQYHCDNPTFVGGYTQLEQLLRKDFEFTSEKCEVFNRALGANGGQCAVPTPRKPKAAPVAVASA
jgi:hypothetical protein